MESASSLQEMTTIQNQIVRLARVLYRQQGMNPGSLQEKNGMVQFEIDVPDKKDDVFHDSENDRQYSWYDINPAPMVEAQFLKHEEWPEDKDDEGMDGHERSLTTRRSAKEEQRNTYDRGGYSR